MCLCAAAEWGEAREERSSKTEEEEEQLGRCELKWTENKRESEI